MKALSLLQPWASLVAYGRKKIETRTWGTRYRGPLAIHASKSDIALGALALASDPTLELMTGELCKGGLDVTLVPLPFGRIIALCDLVGVERITPENVPPEPERSFGDYRPGRYAWHLSNIRRLNPCPEAKGHLGLWNPPDPEGLAFLEVRPS